MSARKRDAKPYKDFASPGLADLVASASGQTSRCESCGIFYRKGKKLNYPRASRTRVPEGEVVESCVFTGFTEAQTPPGGAVPLGR
jgi:hypothetical protein